ncbi:hypothetical protein HOLleu_28334 [Holothuria leucospilota]|uniref:Uncharacterized protein n=1 Tax=Holothuria leucospilota TaxID=206669 RepID=A0A9Q1H1D9_HOLLE|nr:hypothetical protein HOLleu_28334 [Holothuria leucospilota]
MSITRVRNIVGGYCNCLFGLSQQDESRGHKKATKVKRSTEVKVGHHVYFT